MRNLCLQEISIISLRVFPLKFSIVIQYFLTCLQPQSFSGVGGCSKLLQWRLSCEHQDSHGSDKELKTSWCVEALFGAVLHPDTEHWIDFCVSDLPAETALVCSLTVTSL